MDWGETYEGGSAEAEHLAFKALADDIMHAQLKARRAAGEKTLVVAVDRAFHAKALLAVANAELHFRPDLPAELAAGFAQADAHYPVTVRISNAANRPGRTTTPDMRGIALRVKVSAERAARSAGDQLSRSATPAMRGNSCDFAVATAGGTAVAAHRHRGIDVQRRAVRDHPHAAQRLGGRAARSRASRWRPTGAAAPSVGDRSWRCASCCARPRMPRAGPRSHARIPNGLSKEAARTARRRRRSSSSSASSVIVDDRTSTPIEDTSIAWKPEAVAGREGRDADNSAGRRQHAGGTGTVSRTINALAFNPWNTTDEFRPLGNLNRARKDVYDASAAHRLQMRWRDEPPLRNRVFARSVSRAFFKLINRRFEWYRLPLLWAACSISTSTARCCGDKT